MKVAAAHALARLVKKPTAEKIVPGVFEKGVAAAISKAVIQAHHYRFVHKKVDIENYI
jgi:malic enzyme